MKPKKLMIAFLSAVTFVVACKPASDKPAVAESPSSTNNAVTTGTRGVQVPSDKPLREVQDYAYGQKADLVARLREQSAEIHRELESLSVQVENSAEPVKTDGRARIETLRQKLEALNKQIDGLERANESGWEEVKAGFRKTYEEAKQSLRQSREWLSEKIAP